MSGDGVPETLIEPSAELIGTEANDLTAPQVELRFDPQTRLVTLSATDEGSGIYRTLYTYDQQQFQTYVGPFTPIEGATEVSAMAEDLAGNYSAVATLELPEPDIPSLLPHTIYLPFVQQ